MFNSEAERRLESLLSLRDNQSIGKNQQDQVNLWSILKNNIGKELWKITMPVVFNEPLSFLQRLAEYMESYETLIRASSEPHPIKRLELVAAFIVSATASNWQRTGKPFNPILGETFELDRLDDCGFRLVCEQVSHHPPVSAFHCEGRDRSFLFYGSVRPKIKFKGQSLEVQPKGTFIVEFPKLGSTYHWSNVNCIINNLVIGKLSIEQSGCMEIIAPEDNLKCILNYKSTNNKMLSNHIEGHISDSQGQTKFRSLFGVWTHFLTSCDPATLENDKPELLGHKTKRVGSLGSFFKNSFERIATSPQLSGSSFNDDCQPSNTQNDLNRGIQNQQTFANPSHDKPTSDTVAKIESVLNFIEQRPQQYTVLWKVNHRHPRSSEFYSFTNFALTLNDTNIGYVHRLPLTDSRFRPDVRQMEYGNIDISSQEKKRLEDKQRLAKKQSGSTEYNPRWFSICHKPHIDDELWCFNFKYWEKNWANCPDLF